MAFLERAFLIQLGNLFESSYNVSFHYWPLLRNVVYSRSQRSENYASLVQQFLKLALKKACFSLLVPPATYSWKKTVFAWISRSSKPYELRFHREFASNLILSWSTVVSDNSIKITAIFCGVGAANFNNDKTDFMHCLSCSNMNSAPVDQAPNTRKFQGLESQIRWSHCQ